MTLKLVCFLFHLIYQRIPENSSPVGAVVFGVLARYHLPRRSRCTPFLVVPLPFLGQGKRPGKRQTLCAKRCPIAVGGPPRPPFCALTIRRNSLKASKHFELQLVKCIGPAFPIRLIWTPFAENFFEGRFLEPFNGCDEKKRPEVFRFLRVNFQNRELFCIGPGDSKQ